MPSPYSSRPQDIWDCCDNPSQIQVIKIEKTNQSVTNIVNGGPTAADQTGTPLSQATVQKQQSCPKIDWASELKSLQHGRIVCHDCKDAIDAHLREKNHQQDGITSVGWQASPFDLKSIVWQRLQRSDNSSDCMDHHCSSNKLDSDNSNRQSIRTIPYTENQGTSSKEATNIDNWHRYNHQGGNSTTCAAQTSANMMTKSYVYASNPDSNTNANDSR